MKPIFERISFLDQYDGWMPTVRSRFMARAYSFYRERGIPALFAWQTVKADALYFFGE